MGGRNAPHLVGLQGRHILNPFDRGPQAPERNPPIQPDFYSPRYAIISSITPTSPFSTQIVTSEENQFVVGQLVRFNIAGNCGMVYLNEQQGYITSLTNDTTFSVAINTLNQNPFDPSRNVRQSSFVLPIGDTNSGQINSSGRINNTLYIEGSFINISPE